MRIHPRHRPFSVLLGVALFAGLATAGEDIRVGDSREQVLAALGEPRGRMEYEAVELLFYDRGRVELENGEVLLVKLVSVEELARKNAEELQARELAAAQRARRMAELYAEGKSVRKVKLADAGFMQSSASERVAYWKRFRERYPNVPVGDAYTLALEEVQTQLVERTKELEQAQRIENLEDRVRDAEDRASYAEERSRSSRRSYVGLAYTPYYPAYSFNNHYRPRSHHSRRVAKACPPSSAYRPPHASRPVRRVSKPCAVPYYGSGVRISAGYRGSTSYARAGVHF